MAVYTDDVINTLSPKPRQSYQPIQMLIVSFWKILYSTPFLIYEPRFLFIWAEESTSID